jgi:LysM repeat protein
LADMAPCTNYYVVRPGDTLYRISTATGISVDTLFSLNPTVDPFNLREGQRICLSQETGLPTGKVPPCASGFYWVIASGDTLFSIAQEVGTTVEVLMQLNVGIDPQNLQVGDSICLPN